MTAKKTPLWRIYWFSTSVSVALIAFAGIELGLKALLVVLMLAILEVSLSFDNAVINARILRKMSEGWQKVFLTLGILIAVFGVRIILPIFLVAIAVDAGFGTIVNLALNDADQYGKLLHDAHPMIASFGGVFLMMIFLQFFFEKREVKWWPWLEKRLEKVGTLDNISPLIAIGALIIASRFVPQADQETVLVSGLAGMLIYLTIHAIDTILRRSGIEKNLAKGVNNSFKVGLVGFIYLEVIDASFSLDGVIGAFAITNNIILIAIGLGIGALYVRTITIHMLKRGTLEHYRFLEHGAHYAIGILASIMLVSLRYEVPEVITGTAGAAVIIASVLHSKRLNKREAVTLGNGRRAIPAA